MKFRHAKAKEGSVEPVEITLDVAMWDRINIYNKNDIALYAYIQLTEEGIAIEAGGTTITVMKDGFLIRNEP